jgi:hypothetical protein
MEMNVGSFRRRIIEVLATRELAWDGASIIRHAHLIERPPALARLGARTLEQLVGWGAQAQCCATRMFAARSRGTLGRLVDRSHK